MRPPVVKAAPRMPSEMEDEFRHGDELSFSTVFENLAAALDGLADLCAVIQSDIGGSVSGLGDCPEGLVSHLQNIDRLQQNLEDLSTFHNTFSRLDISHSLSWSDQEFLGRYMVLSSLKSRIFPVSPEDMHQEKSGVFDLF